MSVKVLYKVLEGAVAPSYETPGSAGMDIRAFDYGESGGVIAPGETKIFGTGVFVQIPIGYEIQVRSRSGLAAKHNVFVLNSPGTIDSDYRGEIKIILHNAGDKYFHVAEGDRIAQLVVCPIVQANLELTEEFTETERGTGGLGSTGVK